MPDENNKYSVVLSFGVIGYFEFSKSEIHNSLKNIHACLKENGLFILKLDNKTMDNFKNKDNIITDNDLLKYFDFTKLGQYSSKHVLNHSDGSNLYTFYFLNKKSLHNDGGGNITTLITTAPLKSMPDISIIKKTIRSLKFVPEFYKNKVIICCDGFDIKETDYKIHPKCSSYTDQKDKIKYLEYIQNIKKYIAN